MTNEDILNLLKTDYLNGKINITEVKKLIGIDITWSSEKTFKYLGIYNEFKEIQNKRRGLSAKKTNINRHGSANGHKIIKQKKIIEHYDFVCSICNKKISTLKGVGMHLKVHNINAKDYYDIYMKKESEGICPTCGKETLFVNMVIGYNKYCSMKCIQHPSHKGIKWSHPMDEMTKQKHRENLIKFSRQKYNTDNPYQSKEVKQKIKTIVNKKYGVDYVIQSSLIRNEYKASLTKKENKERFEKENNCVEKSKLIEEFGWGWYQAKIVKPIYMFESFGGYNVSFYKIEDIDKIREYSEFHNERQRSNKEVDLVKYIKSFYSNNIITSDRTTIKPKELDIYLPDLRLAIEFNGLYWHSIEMGTPIDYHLQKSILCKKQNIRLVHIYEFEDFDKQKQLLKDLILGVDNYNKEDFNKNNLIDNIPQPIIIFKNDKYTIYGAGELY